MKTKYTLNYRGYDNYCMVDWNEQEQLWTAVTGDAESVYIGTGKNQLQAAANAFIMMGENMPTESTPSKPPGPGNNEPLVIKLSWKIAKLEAITCWQNNYKLWWEAKTKDKQFCAEARNPVIAASLLFYEVSKTLPDERGD